MAASQSAEQKLKVFTPPGGEYYGLCMNNKEKPKLCKALYQAMAEYAKKTPYFKTVTVADLTDLKMFAQLKDEYETKRFDAV